MGKRRHRKLPKELVETSIDRLSHEGRGITTINDKTHFIRDALPEETVKFKYTARNSKFCEGQTIEVIKPSPDRVKPKCLHYEFCGGCSTQHLDHAQQIQFKQQTLLEHLNHFGHIQPQELLPPLLGPQWHYRRKARLGIRYVGGKEKVLVGFREKNGRFIADISSCSILHESLANLMDPFGELIKTLSCFTKIPQVEVAVGDTDSALILRHLESLTDDDISKIENFARTNNLHIYLQPGSPDTIEKLWPKDGQDYLSYELPQHDIQIKFHPSDFTQVNAEINQKMINRAIEFLQVNSKENVLDLFCGLGNFSLPIARQCYQLTGIEGDNSMVEKANQNADLNNITNAKFYSANLFDEKCLDANWANQVYDKILLDPPRSGAELIVKNIKRFNASRIVYISCNPATLARDSKDLIEQGYQLSKAGIMDMFPHTSHVESIAVFDI